MFVGEIGISRHEFLYDISFWEARRIFRGYNKRDHLKHQLLAETVFAIIHVLRDSKGKTVADMFPQIFEDDDDETDIESPLTEDEIREEQAIMAAINAHNQSTEAD